MRLREVLPDLSRAAALLESETPSKPANRGRAFVFAAASALALAGCARYEPGTLPEVRVESQDAAWHGDAALSKDGKRIAFVSERADGRPGLFVRPRSGGEAKALVVGGGEVERPNFFPDGKRILFTRYEPGGARALVIDAEGGEPRALGISGADVRDAVLDGKGERAACVVRDDSSASLVVARIADFALTPVVRGSLADAPARPAWIAKEGGLVFVWRGDLWWTSLDGGVPVCLTPGPARESDPAPSPDGKWIAFASDSMGPSNVWVARFVAAKKGAPPTLQPWRPVTAAFEIARRPAWEKDGRALWFDRQDPWVVVARNFDGGKVDTLSSSLFDATEPTFGGNGTDVVFSSNRGGLGHVFLLDARGEAATGPAKQLTRGDVLERAPSVSKVSGQVAFVAETGDGSRLALTDVGGNALGPIDGVGHDDDPSWSPDGRALAFASDRTGAFEIYRLDGVGRGLTAVTANTAGGAREPGWTPDGQYLLYAAMNQGRRSLWRIPALGGVAVPVTADEVDGSWDAEPAVSPDGARALFTRVRRGDADLWTLDLANGEAHVWFENPKGLDRHADWSPDGRRVVWQSGGAVRLYRADLPPVLRP